jgi:hypothetical protein
MMDATIVQPEVTQAAAASQSDSDLDLSRSIPVQQDDPFLAAIPAPPPDPWAVVSTSAQPAQTYILDAKDLKLPDVPDHAREEIREFLAPLLKDVPVRDNDCWSIAQKFFLAANSPRVSYVEGVWTHKTHYDKHVRGECDCREYARAASPHAYNFVDGYLVDLNTERWTPEEDEWLLEDWWHEPFKIYTFDEINKFLADRIGYGFDGLSITVSIVLEGRAADFAMDFSAEDVDRLSKACELGHRECRYDLERKIFKPALDRMNARLAASAA